MGYNIRSLFAVDLGIKEVEGIVGASLSGALLASLILHIGNLGGIKLGGLTVIKMLGATVGVSTPTAGGIMLFVYGLLLGFPFLVFISGSVNSFVTQIIRLSSKSTLLQKILVPLLNVSALGVTLFALGALYGIVVGIVFFGFAVPLWLSLIGYSGAYTLPSLGLISLAAWLIYGGITGLVYGLIMEN